MMVDFLYPRHECIACVRVKYPEYLAGESLIIYATNLEIKRW